MTLPGIELIEKIGDGGIADVWSARRAGEPDDPSLGAAAETFAVKILRDAGRMNLRRRFLREGRLLQRQAHPGLVRCHAIIDGPQPALVLELLVGEGLDRRLTRGALPVGEVYSLARSLLEILVHLHDQGVVHRDLKASNIWQRDDPGGGTDEHPLTRTVLMDLGLAVDPADPLTSTLGEVVGTHAYMAPEQIAGAKVDVRADLYSLGITLYEALCGQRPYQARGIAGYLQAHRSGRAAPIAQRVPDVDPGFATLVDRLLARDPGDRPQSAAIALALLALGSPLERESPVTVRRLTSPRRPIGREAVRGAVLASLHSADPGGGRGAGGIGLVQLHGELGSGLGAAADQAREIAEDEGVEHVTLRARPGVTPEWALLELARCLDGWAGSVTPTLASVRAALAGLAGEARNGPGLLLVIEDVADDGLVDWIQKLRSAIPELVVVTTGQTPRRKLGGHHVQLRPLTEEETASMVRALLGTRAEPLNLTAAVFGATGGQPALVVVAMRRLADAGALTCHGVEEDGTPMWRWDEVLRPPAALRATRDLQRTLARLPAPARRLLTAIADQQEPTDLDVLEREVAADAAAVYSLLQLGLVEIDGNDRVTLKRPILAEVIRGARPPPRKQEPAPTPAATETLLAEIESQLQFGRPFPQRAVEAVRDLGEGWAGPRAWVLACVALRRGDASTARRRLQRVVALDPDLQTRIAAEAALALIDLELRIGRRTDATQHIHTMLAAANVGRLHRGRLQLRVAQQQVSTLAFAAACSTLREARETLGADAGMPLAQLTWVDILLRAGGIDEAEELLASLTRATDEGCEWSIRSEYVCLLARLRRQRLDPASAHATHVLGEDWAARAGDEPRRAYHAGMAAVLCGNVRLATEEAATLDSPAFRDLRAELLMACARRTRDARLYQLAEASARASGDRSILLGLLYSLRGPGSRAEAGQLVHSAVDAIYSPLRAHFLEMPEVEWARSMAG